MNKVLISMPFAPGLNWRLGKELLWVSATAGACCFAALCTGGLGFNGSQGLRPVLQAGAGCGRAIGLHPSCFPQVEKSYPQAGRIYSQELHRRGGSITPVLRF